MRQAIPGWITDDHKIDFDQQVMDSLNHAFTDKDNLEKKSPLTVAHHILSLYEGYVQASLVASLGFASPQTLDNFLLEAAKSRGNAVHAIEKREDQCNPSLGTANEIAYLDQNLKMMEDLRMGIINESPYEKLIKDYRRGTVEPGMRMISQEDIQIPKNATETEVQELKRNLAKAKQYEFEVLEKRNKKMAARIIDLLRESPDSYFFAFGTLHFIGKDNIPDILRSAGFEVEQVQRPTSGGVVLKPSVLMVISLIICLRV